MTSQILIHIMAREYIPRVLMHTPILHMAHKFKIQYIPHKYSHTCCIIIITYIKYMTENERYKIAYYSETVCIGQHFITLRCTIIVQPFLSYHPTTTGYDI